MKLTEKEVQEVIAKMKGRVEGFHFLSLGFDKGRPFVDDGHGSDLLKVEVEAVADFLQLLLQIYPSDQEVHHKRGTDCGVLGCEPCLARNRKLKIKEVFPFRDLPDKIVAGYVCLIQVGQEYKLFASNAPERRLRQIEAELQEPVRYVHRIATSDQYGLKMYWNWMFIDYYKHSNLFFLPSEAITHFRSHRQMDQEAEKMRIMKRQQGE